jgi:hypothetical protein
LLADDLQHGLVACAGTGGVGPFAGEPLGKANHCGPGHGGALGAVAGEGVGVFDVLGDVDMSSWRR